MSHQHLIRRDNLLSCFLVNGCPPPFDVELHKVQVWVHQPSVCRCYLSVCRKCCDSVCVLDVWVAAQSGRDAVELVTADDDHPERGDVGEAVRQVGQMVLMDEQGDQLFQPADTHRHTHDIMQQYDWSNRVVMMSPATCPCPAAGRSGGCCSGPAAAGDSSSGHRWESTQTCFLRRPGDAAASGHSADRSDIINRKSSLQH